MAARNQADLWRDLVTEAGDEAIAHAANVTNADAQRELAAAGFDVAEERAKAAAHLRAVAQVEAHVGGDTETRGGCKCPFR